MTPTRRFLWTKACRRVPGSTEFFRADQSFRASAEEQHMAQVNLKELVGKLNDTCRRSLEAAAGLCLSRTNYNVEIEHWLLKLLEIANTDLASILAGFEID